MRLPNRIGILAIFGTACALALFLILFFGSIRKREPLSQGHVISRNIPENDPLVDASSSQGVSEVNKTRILHKADFTNTAAGPGKEESLEDLFLSTETREDAAIDWAEVGQLLRDHVSANHPRLALSDADYARMADSLRKYREAKEKIGSLDRTSANSAALRTAIQESKSALETFSSVTGMSLGEFFVDEDAPVKFGSDATGSEDDEIVTEYLSDHKP